MTVCNMCFFVQQSVENPTGFMQACNHHQDADLWKNPISKEFDDFRVHNVWTQVDNLPKNVNPIGSKWEFKTKKDGRKRTRLVALGYQQVPGTDFTNFHSFVLEDVTLRTMIVMGLLLDLSIMIIDIEEDFMEGNLEETLYVRIPAAMQIVLKYKPHAMLHKALYGLVQALHAFYKHLRTTMKN